MHLFTTSNNQGLVEGSSKLGPRLNPARLGSAQQGQARCPEPVGGAPLPALVGGSAEPDRKRDPGVPRTIKRKYIISVGQ